LNKLDGKAIADSTIVVFTTDHGAEIMTWPNGGNKPFHGEMGWRVNLLNGLTIPPPCL
jgi:arylsulfatase